MRQASIYYQDFFAGILTESEDGSFTFQYDHAYVNDHPRRFLTFTLPVTDKPYTSDILFPFFEGLIPEGWLLAIAYNSWKIDRNDRMGLLLACCRDCIGAVSVVPMED